CEARGPVAERRVVGVLARARGQQSIAVPDEMKPVDRDPPGLREGRADQHRIDVDAFLREPGGEGIRLGRKVTSQGGVAATDRPQPAAESPRRGGKALADRLSDGPGVVLGASAGVGEDPEQRACLAHGPFELRLLPAGDERDALDGLRPGRIVVDDRDLDPVPLQVVSQSGAHRAEISRKQGQMGEAGGGERVHARILAARGQPVNLCVRLGDYRLRFTGRNAETDNRNSDIASMTGSTSSLQELAGRLYTAAVADALDL